MLEPSVGLNWTESPSGSNPDGLPAGVRPTRWNVPVMTRNGTAPRQHDERLPRAALLPHDLSTAPEPGGEWTASGLTDGLRDRP